MDSAGCIEVLDIHDGEWWSADGFSRRIQMGEVTWRDFDHYSQVNFIGHQNGEPWILEPFFTLGFLLGCLHTSPDLLGHSCFGAAGDEEETLLIVSDGLVVRVLRCYVGSALGTIVAPNSPVFAPALPGAVEEWSRIEGRSELVRVGLRDWLSAIKCWGEQYRDLLKVLAAAAPNDVRARTESEVVELENGLERLDAAFEMLESSETIEG